MHSLVKRPSTMCKTLPQWTNSVQVKSSLFYRNI